MAKLVLLIIAVLTVGTTGCGPSLTYHVNNKALQQTPPTGSLTFSLRTSDITLTPSEAGNAEASRKQGISQETPAAKAEGGHQETARGAQKGGEAVKTPNVSSPQDICKEAKTWEDCLKGLSIVVTPGSNSSQIITAVPDNFLGLFTTSLSATTVDGDDLLPKVVTVSYRDKTKDVIAGIGSGAATGAPLGPYGMAAGAAAGALTAYLSTTAMPQSSHSFSEFVCSGDKPKEAGLSNPNKPELIVPVTITLGEALAGETNTPDGKECWRLLPKSLPGFQKVVSKEKGKDGEDGGSGWLYRVRRGPIPPKAQSAIDFFGQKGLWGGPKALNTFPFSVCRDANLDIVWWDELQQALNRKRSDEKTPITYNYKTMSITIADPTQVGVAPLPKAGDIDLHTLCGASTTTRADTNPKLGETIDAALKTIKQIKDAQKQIKDAQSNSQVKK